MNTPTSTSTSTGPPSADQNHQINQTDLKKEILKELEICWRQPTNSNLRFGYMLAAIIRNGQHQIKITDEELLQKIKEFYAELP